MRLMSSFQLLLEHLLEFILSFIPISTSQVQKSLFVGEEAQSVSLY